MNIRHFFWALAVAALLPAVAQAGGKGPEWLSKAVFYQIYPSSYMDSNGDGVGDLPGIASRLDYLKQLGVNALWLNPVYESGWFDGGYDIIDFYKVDPRFGNNDDLVRLVDEAHKRGMKVCLDLVAGHSSDKCQWFVESQQGTNGRYSDYYIWSDTIGKKDAADIARRRQAEDPKASTIGHWVEADAPRGKYYYKNYYECQPALNYGYAHPSASRPWEQGVDAPGPQAVRRELRNIMAFWMDKGVDGFRVDMAASLVKGDKDKKATMQLWGEMRRWLDEHYPQNVLISEWSYPQQSIMAGFNIDFEIHIGRSAYSSLFFQGDTPWGKTKKIDNCYFNRLGKGSLKDFVNIYAADYNATKDRGYIAIPTANHDFQRPNVGTRNSLDQLKVAMTFFLTMPGVPFIYYGDELGMKYQDGIAPKEGSRNRAGSRTPMQWTPGPTAGFSTCAPAQLYFPVATDGGKLTVEAEEKDPGSMLNYVKRLLALRASVPALGNDAGWQLLNTLDGEQYPMVYLRTAASGERCLVALNPSEKAVTLRTGQPAGKVLVSTGKGSYKHGTVKLAPFSAIIVRL